jgi:hypothetical protein
LKRTCQPDIDSIELMLSVPNSPDDTETPA